MIYAQDGTERYVQEGDVLHWGQATSSASKVDYHTVFGLMATHTCVLFGPDETFGNKKKLHHLFYNLRSIDNANSALMPGAAGWELTIYAATPPMQHIVIYKD